MDISPAHSTPPKQLPLPAQQADLAQISMAQAGDLVSAALASGDLYAAAAVYGIADADSQPALEQLLFSQRRTMLMLARWEHTPPPVLTALVLVHDAGVHKRLRSNPNTSAAALSSSYALDDDPELRKLIACHAHTPPAVLAQLIQHCQDELTLRLVCRNPAADASVLRLLVQRLHGALDKSLVTHAAMPADLLQTLFERGDRHLQAAVLLHANCPQALIAQLSATQDVLLQASLARHAAAGLPLLQRLVASREGAVRAAVAAHAAATPDLLSALCGDSLKQVRRALAARADLTPEHMTQLAADADPWVRQWLARNRHTPVWLLRQLASDVHPDVRRAVARNEACAVFLLEKLATDANAWVRAAVAYQSNATTLLMLKLARDTNVDVLSGVAHNLHTPPSILWELAGSANPDIRRGVILNPAAQREHLLMLLEDPYYLHRVLLIASPRLLAADKWPLRLDPDPNVRFAAWQWFAAQARQQLPAASLSTQ